MSEYTSYDQHRAVLQLQVDHSLKMIGRVNHGPNISGASDDTWKARFNAELDPVLNVDDASRGLAHPPRSTSLQWLPDYALPMFTYVKTTGINPAMLAQRAAEHVAADRTFNRVEATGPYLNLRLSDEVLIDSLNEIFEKGKDYGTLTDEAGKVALVEYSSPNITKPLGIDCLRSTVIGESLAHFLSAVGYAVVRDNHIGDWGAQAANLLAACDEYVPDCEFASFSTDDLIGLYDRFNHEKKESPRLIRRGQDYLARLEAGDIELLDHWATALTLSLNDFSALYERLNIRFDTMLGESYFVQDSNKVVDDLRGAVSPDLVVHDHDTPAVYTDTEQAVVIRTQDGYDAYAARDLATVRFRAQTYRPDVALYVVGNEQSTYFRSLFAVAESAGLNRYPNGSSMRLEHVSFGLLLDGSGKRIALQAGTDDKLESILDQLNEHAAQGILSRNPDMGEEQLRDIANKVAVGALVWNELRTDRTSNSRFDIDRMLELGGGTVVDVFYAYARTCSILDKFESPIVANVAEQVPKEFSTETEHRIALMMSEYGDMVRKTAEARAPHLFAAYLQELVQLHGRFYEESNVVGLDDPKLTNLRVTLHRAYKIVIENGLALLNIPVAERL